MVLLLFVVSRARPHRVSGLNPVPQPLEPILDWVLVLEQNLVGLPFENALSHFLALWGESVQWFKCVSVVYHDCVSCVVLYLYLPLDWKVV